MSGVDLGMRPMTRSQRGVLHLGLLLWVMAGEARGVDSAVEPSGEVSACGSTATMVARIQKRYDGIRDLSARFEQVSHTVVLGGAAALEPAASQGEVVLAKPGRMRWSYLEPEPSFVISDGRVVWIYDVGGRQVTRVRVDRDYLAGAALQFLLGQGQLAEAFAIEETGCEDGQIQLALLPREPAGYERLWLTAETTTGLVTATSIVDLFGNQTSLRFMNIEVNQSPEPSIFEFSLPEGVELLEVDTGP
ncbi:MAG: outer membrane lipoprotein carrier protein LolA [Myxococcota bacterium]